MKVATGKQCSRCGATFAKGPNRSQKRWALAKFCSHQCASVGRPLSPETRAKMSASRTGKKFTPEHCANISAAQRGERGHNWQGGIASQNTLIRKGLEMRAWRTAVFERDNYTCVHCGDRRGPFNADHILPFSTHPHLRFELTNGRTLCVPCHRATPTYGWRAVAQGK